MNTNIIESFQALITKTQNEMKETNNKSLSFKINTYRKVIKIISQLNYEITSSSQLKDFKGVGQKSLEKIDEILSSGTLNVGKRPITLSGKRTEKRGSRVVNARELKIRNLVDGETLKISGNGTIPNTSLETHTLAVDRLAIRDSSGSASNYTLVGGSHTFQIDLSKKKIVLDKLETFKKSGKKLMPKMVAARAAPAISVAAPRPARAGGGGASGGRGPVGGGTTGGGSSSSGGSSSGGNTNSGGSSDSDGGTSDSSEGDGESGASNENKDVDAI